MGIIEAVNISKKFKVKVKGKGLSESFKSIINPEYREIQAVDNLSLSVEKGEILAFIGPNGAGKSTTIKMLTGILYKDGGNIEVNGIDPTKERKKLAYSIGTVFGQKEQLWIHLTPYDNFKFFGAIYDIEGKQCEKRIDELAEIIGLKEFINTPVKALSLGQRIKCEIAASLIHKPEILFLDEPTIGLDPVAKEAVRELIRDMNSKLNTTVFLTSHDIGDIEKLCKRVIIINNGHMVMDSHIDKLKYSYLNRKIVEVKLNEKVSVEDGVGVKVLMAKGLGLKLEVDTRIKSMAEVLLMLEPEKIADITISNIPMEEIIAGIYKEGI